MELKFERLAEEGKVLEQRVPTFRAAVSGPGNEIKLEPIEGGENVMWRREQL